MVECNAQRVEFLRRQKPHVVIQGVRVEPSRWQIYAALRALPATMGARMIRVRPTSSAGNTRAWTMDRMCNSTIRWTDCREEEFEL